MVTTTPYTTVRSPADTDLGIKVELVPLAIALLAVGIVSRGGGPEASVVDDRIVAFQLLCAVGIALTLMTERTRIRQAESHAAPPSLGMVSAIGIIAGVGALVAPELGRQLLGPTITCGAVGSYLACHGLRAPAVLRRVAALSLGIWLPVATLTVGALSSALTGPSDLLYRRLYLVPGLADPEAPWRLATSTLSTGILVPVAVALLWWSWGTPTSSSPAERDRARLRVGAVSVVALLVHHVVVLRAPVDAYSADRLVRLVTGPGFDLVVGAVAFAVVAASLTGRSVRAERREVPHRDPYLFGAAHDRSMRGTGVLVMACWLPLVAVALAQAS